MQLACSESEACLVSVTASRLRRLESLITWYERGSCLLRSSRPQRNGPPFGARGQRPRGHVDDLLQLGRVQSRTLPRVQHQKALFSCQCRPRFTQRRSSKGRSLTSPRKTSTIAMGGRCLVVLRLDWIRRRFIRKPRRITVENAPCLVRHPVLPFAGYRGKEEGMTPPIYDVRSGRISASATVDAVAHKIPPRECLESTLQSGPALASFWRVSG